MKRKLLMVAMAVVVTGGCANSTQLISTSSVSTRNDIFTEATATNTTTQGYTELNINASLKTHKRDAYFFGEDAHGTKDYSLLVNIDGQAVHVNTTAVEENLEPRFTNDPEAGVGSRYSFKKEILLKPGIHKVVVAIPAEGLAVEREILVIEGASNNLKILPTYGSVRQRVGFYGVTSHKEGIKDIQVLLNGKPL